MVSPEAARGPETSCHQHSLPCPQEACSSGVSGLCQLLTPSSSVLPISQVEWEGGPCLPLSPGGRCPVPTRGLAGPSLSSSSWRRSTFWREAQQPLPLPSPSHSGDSHLSPHLRQRPGSPWQPPFCRRAPWGRQGGMAVFGSTRGCPPGRLLGVAVDGHPELGWVCNTGFSLQGYGRAQHSISTEKIKAMYPDYEVTWADDGY